MFRYELTLGIETTHSHDGKREVVYRHAEGIEIIGDHPQKYAEQAAMQTTMLWLCRCERIKRVSLADITTPDAPRIVYQCDDVDAPALLAAFKQAHEQGQEQHSLH